jgi:hypothetical protein
VSGVDRRIAAANNHEVAVQCAVGCHRSSGKDARRKTMVPTESLRGRSRSEKLLVRRRNQKVGGVERVERFVMAQRVHIDAPMRVRNRRGGEHLV